MSSNSTTMRKSHSSISSSDEKSGSDDTHEKLVIGLTAKQLEIARQTKYWKTWRIATLVLFWLLWAGMVTGAVLIIVLKNGDVPKTTTVIITETTTHK